MKKVMVICLFAVLLMTGNHVVPDKSEIKFLEWESEEKAEKTNSSSAACVYCEGRGYCDECSGLGECAFCFGEGEIACSTCGGSGTCQRCYGLGGENHYSFATGGIEWIECSYCNGGGSCRKCGGSRYETCPVCYGTGSCRTCSGTGICSYCGGTGKNA